MVFSIEDTILWSANLHVAGFGGVAYIPEVMGSNPTETDRIFRVYKNPLSPALLEGSLNTHPGSVFTIANLFRHHLWRHLYVVLRTARTDREEK